MPTVLAIKNIFISVPVVLPAEKIQAPLIKKYYANLKFKLIDSSNNVGKHAQLLELSNHDNVKQLAALTQQICLNSPSYSHG